MRLLAGRAVAVDAVVVGTDVVEAADVLGINVGAAKGLKLLRLVVAGCLGMLLVVGSGGIIVPILSCLGVKFRSEARVWLCKDLPCLQNSSCQTLGKPQQAVRRS